MYNNIPDTNTIGGFNYSWDFDRDEYEDWLLDEEMEDSPEAYKEYIENNVTFTCEYVDHETLHSTGEYADFSYEDLIDEYGERVAKSIREDLESGTKEGFMDKMDLFDEEFDVNDPYELANAAMKILPHGEYFKDARGFILANGVVVYTDAEHNECGMIPGVDGTFHFIRLGNIRVLPNGIDIGKKPTREQKNTLARVISSYSEDRLYVDFMTNNSEYGVTYTFYSDADWRTVLNEIDRYFREGIKPQDRVFECRQMKKLNKLNESKLRNMIIGIVEQVIDEKIEIKPENKGKFTATKERTGKSTEELTHSKNPLTRKRANFARMAKRGWRPLKADN